MEFTLLNVQIDMFILNQNRFNIMEFYVLC